MAGPNTDGGEQFGDYDEAEYNRQMMIAEINTCHQALQANTAELERLQVENDSLRHDLKVLTDCKNGCQACHECPDITCCDNMLGQEIRRQCKLPRVEL